MEEGKLILLPGLDGTGELFEPLLKALSGKRTIEIIRYPTERQLTYNELSEYVNDIIKDKSSVCLVAESFSGPVALKLLKENKNKIKEVILVASFITPPGKYLLKLASLFPVESLLKYGMPDYLIKRYCLGLKATDEMLNTFKKAIKLVNPKVLADRLREITKLNKHEFDGLSGNKITYIQAKNDKLVSKNCLRELASVVPVEVKLINGPHFLLQAQPRECAEIILKCTSP